MIEQPHHPRSMLLPGTTTGRWSVVLAVVSLGALAGFFLMVEVGQRGGDGFFDNWLLSGPMLVVLVAGAGGLVGAVGAVLRRGERGLLIALPILWGLVVALQALGELLVPH